MIQKIEMSRYFINKFVIFNLYISRLIDNKIKVVKIIAKIHLMKNFKTKLFIDIDILDFKIMKFNFHNKTLTIKEEDG